MRPEHVGRLAFDGYGLIEVLVGMPGDIADIGGRRLIRRRGLLLLILLMVRFCG